MKLKIILLTLFISFLVIISSTEKKEASETLEEAESKLNQKGSHLDVVFVIDSTGSMGPYIANTRKVIKNTMKRFLERGQNIKFGIVAYKDYPPQEELYITKVSNLNNYEETLKFIDEIHAMGGGDAPEAVLTGLQDAVTKITWRNIITNNDEEKYKKVIFHVGDQPPHGRDFTDNYDFFPLGEPGDGISLENLSEKLNQENIIYYFCKLSEATNKMEEKFKEKIKIMNVIDISDKNVESQDSMREFSKYATWSESEEFKGDFEESIKARGHVHMKSMIYEAAVSNSLLEL